SSTYCPAPCTSRGSSTRRRWAPISCSVVVVNVFSLLLPQARQTANLASPRETCLTVGAAQDERQHAARERNRQLGAGKLARGRRSTGLECVRRWKQPGDRLQSGRQHPHRIDGAGQRLDERRKAPSQNVDPPAEAQDQPNRDQPEPPAENDQRRPGRDQC